MIRLLLGARYVSSALVALLLVGLLALGRHATYEQSIQSFFAEDDPAVLDYQRMAQSFGNDQFVFVAYDDRTVLTPAGIDRVAELAREVGPDRIDGVIRVESLDAMPVLWSLDDALLAMERLPGFLRDRAVRQAKGMLRGGGAGMSPTIGAAIRAADPEGLLTLRTRIVAHPLLRGTLIDAVGGSTALVVRLKSPTEHDVKVTIASLRATADAFAARHALGRRPAIVGPPVLLADGFASTERDGHRLALAGMVLIGLVTLTATQSLWWAVVPILAGWVVWLATEALLATFHITLSLSGGPLVAQIIVLTMPAASHLAIHYRDERRQDPDARHASTHTLRAVAAPIVWCALTGTIGYGALLTSNVVPIRQFGAILAVCTLAAAVLTMALSPLAMLPPFRLEVPVRAGSTSRVMTALNRLTARVCRHPGPVVLAVVMVVVPLSAGMLRLTYESNYINAFKPESRVVRDYRFVEDRLGGIGLVALVVPVGPTIDMATLDKFRGLDRAIAAQRSADGPAVAQVLSLATVLDPDGKLLALPAARRARALATKLELIAASPQGDLLGGFWDPKTGVARVMVRVSEQQPAPEKEATFGAALRSARAAFGPESYLTGLSYLLTKTTRGVIATQWTTFFWSTAGILVMLTLALRGLKLALLAMLPTMLAVGLVLGLMGWLEIKLDMATALVASVALGLSVDDTFHCLLQFRRLRAAAPFREALLASYAVTGPGVLLSSVAVAIGFAVLRFSEFAPFSTFGTMVCIATAGSSLGNLILLPACLSLAQPRAHRLDDGLKGPERPAPAGSSSAR